jgi:threonine/homoserine/homoserine lactone efflux protein
MQIITGIWLGLFLSFLGQLPVGTMSLTATQIAVQENIRNAWKYSLGVALVEMIYLRLILSGLQWIGLHRDFFIWFNGLTVILFLGIGIWSLVRARRQDQSGKTLILTTGLDRFFLGAIMSLLNPAQIPFWIIWPAYFLNMGWLTEGFQEFNFFTIGSGIGTLTGLAVYIYGGRRLIRKLKTSNKLLNQIAGVIFICAAVLQCIRGFNL